MVPNPNSHTPSSRVPHSLRILQRVRFLNFSSKKVLDNRYTNVITYCMLSRQLTRPTHPPAKLTPSLPYSCSLFAFVPALPSFRINHLQPLFTKHPGGGVPNTSTPSIASTVTCAMQRLYPLRPQPVPHTPRRNERGPLPSISHPKGFLCAFAPLWQIPFCSSFVFMFLQIPLPACPPTPSFPFIHLQIPLRATPFVSHPYKTTGVWGRECRLC
jgi:hypothetical protein